MHLVAFRSEQLNSPTNRKRDIMDFIVVVSLKSDVNFEQVLMPSVVRAIAGLIRFGRRNHLTATNTEQATEEGKSKPHSFKKRLKTKPLYLSKMYKNRKVPKNLRNKTATTTT